MQSRPRDHVMLFRDIAGHSIALNIHFDKILFIYPEGQS